MFLRSIRPPDVVIVATAGFVAALAVSRGSAADAPRRVQPQPQPQPQVAPRRPAPCVGSGGEGIAGKVVIAHRGASGYLPEHTLAAKAVAHAMGAHYIEQDVVLSRDGRAVVSHDIHIDAVTNVTEVFPDRARGDGRYYAIDFTWDELRALRVHERTDLGDGRAVYPGRFPVGASRFGLHTLEEELELIAGLNTSTGRHAGIYVELKAPAWHAEQGQDIGAAVLAALARHGYTEREHRAYVQCFDPDALRALRTRHGTRLKLIQLIGDNAWGEAAADFDAMRTPQGLAEIASYADGIGPWLPHLITGRTPLGTLAVTSLASEASARGLAVHPYTLRADALPEYVGSFDELLHIAFFELGLDGLFTDFPDRAVEVLRRATTTGCRP